MWQGQCEELLLLVLVNLCFACLNLLHWCSTISSTRRKHCDAMPKTCLCTPLAPMAFITHSSQSAQLLLLSCSFCIARFCELEFRVRLKSDMVGFPCLRLVTCNWRD